MADEYIKRSDALTVIERFNGYLDDDMQYRIKFMLNRDCPAADVRPVVFCKDCQYISHFTDGHLECRLFADLRPIPCTYVTMKETDFCSYGKRRWELDADMLEVQYDN